LSKKGKGGRGVFEHHSDYLEYQKTIANHPAYAGMPGAFRDDGSVLWQTSSGRTTPFFEFYERRFQWWVAKADELGLLGAGKENDRFTNAARLIHPTGLRPCLVCGTVRNVGYYYANSMLAKRINSVLKAPAIQRASPIDEVIDTLNAAIGVMQASNFLRKMFPERRAVFDEYGVTPAAFQKSRALRSFWLSPGFMGDPPHRFDGLHDYCLTCRPGSDPGRSVENLKSYAHDRRTFEWWVEGDWLLADALFNLAGEGVCDICGKAVQRVSPDHSGPLACGFKHMALFIPTCHRCNSSKNRRMRARDVSFLVEYERRTGESVASWAVRPLWDAFKDHVTTDEQAAELSSSMRAVHHHYLLLLYDLLRHGQTKFLTSLIETSRAFVDVEFVGLDRGLLTYDEVIRTPNDSEYRRGLAKRIVRIAVTELVRYAQKEGRKLRTDFDSYFAAARSELEKSLGPSSNPSVDKLPRLLEDGSTDAESDTLLTEILAGAEDQLPAPMLRAELERIFEGAVANAVSLQRLCGG
jgi:Alw26I/Eco31I/Esp3I family type II restriction endonuclease